ncbi:surface lipoprotein assembly modifier [Altericroceibacterium xinjiangense]|uniref:surface lipoprotein assembly modifier n=1 Tax=Altericroceibacterium xinjiangense TaxID=762261 RepID=UPI000F7DE6F8|nr:surface lipoprotein assembly modifier [Altericroceibacterium xinjiangense]
MLVSIAAAAAPLTLAAATQAAATPALPLGAPVRSRELSAIEVFAVAERAQSAGQNEEAIRLYDALTQDRNADVRAEARFRKGMLLAALTRYREAATTFRALLDEKPDAARVRLEMARVLALMGDESGARRELRQVQATGVPEQVARAVGQFDAALRSHKRAGLRLEFALAPDTNINRATEVRTINTVIAPLTLSSDARAQSGLGVRLSGEGYWKIPVGAGISVVPRINSLATFYSKSEFNDITTTALVGLEVQGKHDRFSPSIGHGWRRYGKRSYMHTDVATLEWIHALGRRAQLNGSVSAATTDYQLNDLQDGALYSVSAGVERALSARSGISATLTATRQTARDPGYATASGGVRLLGWREAGRTTLFAAAALQRTEGDAALVLFGDRRREWFASVRAGGTFRAMSVRGFAPYARVGYEHNASSVALYDYRRFTSEFGIARAF